METDNPISARTLRSDWPNVQTWEGRQDLNFSLKLSFFFILHTAFFLCANECNTTNAFGEGLSKTMCHLRMIHASSLMIMAFAIVVWLLNSNICAPRPTRSHPRLSNTESALSHPSASHTDAQGTLWCLCAARKCFLPESFSKIFNV